jgi:hypothetical protein
VRQRRKAAGGGPRRPSGRGRARSQESTPREPAEEQQATPTPEQQPPVEPEATAPEPEATAPELEATAEAPQPEQADKDES